MDIYGWEKWATVSSTSIMWATKKQDMFWRNFTVAHREQNQLSSVCHIQRIYLGSPSCSFWLSAHVEALLLLETLLLLVALAGSQWRLHNEVCLKRDVQSECSVWQDEVIRWSLALIGGFRQGDILPPTTAIHWAICVVHWFNLCTIAQAPTIFQPFDSTQTYPRSTVCVLTDRVP